MTLTPETQIPEARSPQAGSGDLATVKESTLPVSGLRVVLTHRGPRQTLEIDDAQGRLVSVISDSLLDPTVVRGAWHGVHDGQPWALVIGRSVSGQISVTFSRHRRRLLGWAGRRNSEATEVKPRWIGEFWVAEAAVEATRATVAVAGIVADSFALEPVSG